MEKQKIIEALRKGASKEDLAKDILKETSKEICCLYLSLEENSSEEELEEARSKASFINSSFRESLEFLGKSKGFIKWEEKELLERGVMLFSPSGLYETDFLQIAIDPLGEDFYLVLHTKRINSSEVQISFPSFKSLSEAESKAEELVLKWVELWANPEMDNYLKYQMSSLSENQILYGKD